jgi:hypothetical protein
MRLHCLIRKVRVLINFVVVQSSFRSKTANGKTSGMVSSTCRFVLCVWMVKELVEE